MTKGTVIKSIFFIVISILVHIVINAFEPVVSANLAVQQLQDSYDSNARLTIYQQIKQYSSLFYVVIFLLFFYKELKQAIKFIKK